MIGWNHPTDEADQWDGFNDSGMEHFSGTPLRSLAREIVQNSLDSHDSELGRPVLVTIDEITIPTDEIPGIEEMRETFELCLMGAANESQKCKQFFERALKELKGKNIKALSISDYHTKGISGPATNGKPYFSFMKAKGQSKKSTETAGGSFGIGKFAPYAVSKLRTVFVSTVFREEGNEQYFQYTQGKAILMSHDRADKRYQAIGFWGVKDRCQPVIGQEDSLPLWLTRAKHDEKLQDVIGTKLIVLGFDEPEGWQESLAASIAENFFGAIKTEKLEVQIQNKYNITSYSLEEIFSNSDIKKSIEQDDDEPDRFENSHSYYECLSNHEDSFLETHQNKILGHCEMKLIVREGLPKKVCFLRNGMFITDTLSVPGLKNFSDFKDFTAVIQSRDDKGIELLRAMEPPLHNNFEPNRLTTAEEKAKGQKALIELARWIRDMLRRRAKDEISEVTRLDELKDFFADDTEDGKGNGIEEINPTGAILIKAKPIKRANPKLVSKGDDDSEKGDKEGGEGGGGDDGAGGGDGNGGKGDAGNGGGGGGGKIKPAAPIENPRALITESNKRRISFTPLSDGNYEISLAEVGADSEYPLNINKSTTGVVRNGKIIIEAKKGVRNSMEIELSEHFDGALKVLAHEI